MMKNMDMKLLALSAGENSGILARISGALSSFAQENAAFAVYPTLKAMLPDFAAAVKNARLIVLAIDKSQYNVVRAKLCAALSLRVTQDDKIYRLLSESTGLSHEEKLRNAVVPEGARVFLSEDGIHSGFAVQKGAQCILFLPLDSDRIDRILKNGVVPYLMRREVQQAPQKAPKAEAAPRAEDFDPFSADVMRHTLNALRESGARVAVSSTPAAQTLKTMGASHADFEDFFVFTPHVEDKGDYNTTDYAALTAKSARELAKTQLGACISEMDSGEGGDFIYITVADDKTAVVRKLYREDRETERDFMQDATEELVALIAEKMSGRGAVGIEVAGAAPSERTGFFSTKSGKIAAAVFALVLIAAIVLGCVLFVRESKKAEQPTTTAPIITQSQTAGETPVVTNTLSLSELMYKEMREGVGETPAEVTTENPSGAAIDITGNAGQTASDIPETMLVNGREMDAKEALAKMLAAESTDTILNEEALKAQAVAAYTYLKYRNTNWKITGVSLADEYSDEVYNAVRAVFGEYLSFGNAPAFTPFFRLSAGRTTAADAVYGKNFPYLRAVDSVSDKTQDEYKTELIFSATDLRDLVLAYDANLTLGDDPSQWIEITRHDGAVNVGVGYVETISVGGKEISGIDFVKKVLQGKNLPSQCFSVTYAPNTDEFMFEIYGVGYGVGMSLLGADKMAATGSGYAEILSKFYGGTQLTA